MENIVRTVYGAYLQTCQLLDINVDIAPFSTLNEKFNVNENVHHTRENPLSMKYVAIGLGGHKMVLGNNGFIFQNLFNIVLLMELYLSIFLLLFDLVMKIFQLLNVLNIVFVVRKRMVENHTFLII